MGRGHGSGVPAISVWGGTCWWAAPADGLQLQPGLVTGRPSADCPHGSGWCSGLHDIVLLVKHSSVDVCRQRGHLQESPEDDGGREQRAQEPSALCPHVHHSATLHLPAAHPWGCPSFVGLDSVSKLSQADCPNPDLPSVHASSMLALPSPISNNQNHILPSN